MARLLESNITAQQVIVNAINLYAGVGGSLAASTSRDRDLELRVGPVRSGVRTDCTAGCPSRSAHLVQAGNSTRTLTNTPTRSRTICYTNVVGIADL